MPRCNGSYIGYTPSPTANSASGMWTVREAESYLRADKWPATPTVPGAPTGTPGNGQVALTWTAPTGGSTPTDYVVQYSSNGGSTWTTFSDGVSSATSATVTGLTNGTGYIFRIKAVNTLGEGPAGSASGTITPAEGPSSVTGLALWLDPAGAVVSSGSVTSWPASVGAFTASVAEGDPTYASSGIGGMPAVVFDGASSMLIDDAVRSGTEADPFTLFAVLKPSTSGGSRFFCLGGESNGSMVGFLSIAGSPSEWAGAVGIAQTSETQIQSGDSNTENIAVLLCLTYDGSANSELKLYVNNTLAGTDTFTGSSLTHNGRVTVGDQPNESFGFTGAIGDLLVYDSCLGSSDRTLVANYLMSKYGI